MLTVEDKLTTAAIAGDTDALRQILRGHDAELRERLAGKIRTTHRAAFDVDDVLQVTYLEAFLRIAEFVPNGRGAFGAWLGRIADNNLIDAARELECEKRQPRNKQVMLPGTDESYVALLAFLGDSAGSPSKHLRKQDAKTALEEALGQLPPDYETVVRMIDLQDMSAGDVAESMGRSVASVYMLKARAHARLAELLGSGSRF